MPGVMPSPGHRHAIGKAVNGHDTVCRYDPAANLIRANGPFMLDGRGPNRSESDWP
ncbi:hypothetical protein DF3PA_20062 [Candidatus Defluviicoccus seviourii]|uniref:Uncharacterized protein n=1 Tax=Candidatus Defluviicoccus seviourii TaxID=2565273 RepID=A0A564WCG4_9PROT|nr:hypothetical protein DF3PA_20062 [Candidatus Defluviicoccus seviourii]